MDGPGQDVELGRHSRTNQASGVVDIFIHKKVECADTDESWWQTCEVGNTSRNRSTRYFRPTGFDTKE